MINVNNVSYYLDESGKMLYWLNCKMNGTDYSIDASGVMSRLFRDNSDFETLRLLLTQVA